MYAIHKHQCNHTYVFRSACPCAKREDSKPLMKGYQMEYAQLVEELVNSGRYDTRDDFTVVVQPHYRDMLPIYTVSSNFNVFDKCPTPFSNDDIY